MRFRSCFLLAALLLAAGCNRQPTVLMERTALLEVGDVKAYSVEAAKADREVHVEVNAAALPVSVYVVQEKDRAAAMEALAASKQPGNLLAARENSQQSSLVTRVPADDGFAVLLALTNGKSTGVTLKVTAK